MSVEANQNRVEQCRMLMNERKMKSKWTNPWQLSSLIRHARRMSLLAKPCTLDVRLQRLTHLTNGLRPRAIERLPLQQLRATVGLHGCLSSYLHCLLPASLLKSKHLTHHRGVDEKNTRSQGASDTHSKYNPSLQAAIGWLCFQLTAT